MTNDETLPGISIRGNHRRDTLMNIATFVARRLAFGALVLLMVIFLSYLGLDMARGVAFYPALGRALTDTVNYLGRLVRGELGLSVAGSVTLAPVTVAEVVPTTLSKSLGLLAVSLLIATVIGVTLGIWAAWRKRTGWTLVTILVSIVGVSVPSFFAALLLQLAAIHLGRVVGQRILPVGGFGWDEHLIMPALVLAARPIAQIYRMTFVSVSDVLEHDYVRTARSKGLRELVVMLRHVFRNAAIPILTTVGLSLRFSLSSLPVVEFFFSWPGVGFTLLKAISRQDDNLTVALVLCLGILFIGVNLILEVAYRLIDPRLREQGKNSRPQERGNLARALRGAVEAAMDWLSNNPLKRWLEQRRGDAGTESPFRAALEERGATTDLDAGKYQAERLQSWLRATVHNLPFVVGIALVGGLFFLFLFGPGLAPHSPYTRHGMTYIDGEISMPPFDPGETYPWGTDVLGRDIMSLVLAGAQQTLLLAILVVAARIAIGLLLGALAGWFSGSWLDRLVMSLAEVIAAFPALLLAMMFILALGIRQGFRPFVIALCLVGWGEVMQFVRGEVMSIRPKLYIESAVALGLTTPRIIIGHILPNLLSALISITALEMGAVLMLLGELGFVGIFIGGGAFAELQWMAPPYHFSDVPEWGALLSNVRRYARSYPWMALYPSLAFFVAILGFNFLGEGMRRLVEAVGVGITRLVNRYTLAVTVLAVVGFGWVKANTGAMAFYQRQAGAFDGEWAYAHMQGLTHPVLEGRALGTDGMWAAASHIAQQFEALGLQPAGEEMTYFQPRERSFERLSATPKLNIEDGGPEPVYRRDFVEYPTYACNLGQVEGRLHFLAAGELTRIGQWDAVYPSLRELDFSDQICLVLAESELEYLQGDECAGFLVVAQDSTELIRRRTLSSRHPRWAKPMLWISEPTADRLLEGTGRTVAELRRLDDELDVDEVFDLLLEKRAALRVEGEVEDRVPVRHVIGHLPGIASSIEGAPEAEAGKLDNQLIVVMAQYDAPLPGPGGEFYPAANDNASGVAVMLEAIRAIQKSGYQPYRSFLFVAYSAEGLEGGEPVYPPEVDKFLEAKKGFAANFEVEAVVDLRGVGAGDGDELIISAGGSARLADLFEEAASQMNVPVRRGGEAVDISIVFEERELEQGGQEAPNVGLNWEGWRTNSGTEADTLEAISEEKLEQAGHALTLALMIMGRETQY